MSRDLKLVDFLPPDLFITMSWTRIKSPPIRKLESANCSKCLKVWHACMYVSMNVCMHVCMYEFPVVCFHLRS